MNTPLRSETFLNVQKNKNMNYRDSLFNTSKLIIYAD